MLSCDGFQASEFIFALGICSRDSAFTVRYSQTVVYWNLSAKGPQDPYIMDHNL